MVEPLRFVVKAIAIKEIVQITLVCTSTPEVLEVISQLYGQQVVVVAADEDEFAEAPPRG